MMTQAFSHTTELPESLKLAMQQARVSPENIGIIVKPLLPNRIASPAQPNVLATGRPLLEHHADQLMNPASTMKLVTGFIALDELGPQFQWHTRFLHQKPIRNGILEGDLYLRGGGDPNFTWDKLAGMLRKLRQQSLHDIRGNIVLDRAYFSPERPDQTDADFDQFPMAYYNVIPDALLIHSNLVSYSIESDHKKISPQLQTPLAGFSFETHLKLTEQACSEWKKNGFETKPEIKTQQNRLIMVLSGSFPKNCQFSQHLNLIDRNHYIEHLIRQLWTELGGHWKGDTRSGTTPEDAIVLTEKTSDTLAETLRIVNKFSDNTMARSLYLTLGAESSQKSQYPNYLQAADARIHAWFERQGILSSGITLENGAGLSRTERISPLQLSELLQVAANSHWYPEFAGSLPIVALDGTMKKRLNGIIASGSMRIKTGTLNDATAIAGYVRDVQGQTWIVVAFIKLEEYSKLNQAKSRVVLDELLHWVYSGKP